MRQILSLSLKLSLSLSCRGGLREAKTILAVGIS